MAITRTLSDVTKGADLLKPQLNIAYIAAATVSIVVLLFVWKMGTLIFAKSETFVEGRIPGAAIPDYKTALGII
jgi:hypothetical protein